MGITISMYISKSVTKDEWEKVYEETLIVAARLGLVEKHTIQICGIDTVCLSLTREREESNAWLQGTTEVGWHAVGDGISLKTAEDYFLPRKLFTGNEVMDENAGDAILGSMERFMEDEEEEFDVYHLWGNKTQGENYHILLLAIACLIEDRLGTKAFTYGDITRGQCKRAVRIINSYLEEPIDMPDSCDLERWVKRVSNLPISELVQLGIFEDFYLGTEDAEFGNCMRDHFTSEALEAYWKKRFDNCKLGTLGFSQTFKEYMLWGFDLQKTCGYVSLVDQDGNWLYDKFIISVMNAKLYLADKNCTDKLEIDREEEGTYGINTIMAHFVYARYRNPRVNRYIPLEDIRMALKAGIGKGMEQLIDDLIDVYLAEESDDDDSQNKAAIFSDNMDTLRQNLQEEWKQYSINDTEHFKYFKKDNTVNPALLETLKLFKMDCNRKLDLSEYDQLMKKSVQERCQWLSKENRYLLIRDVDWNKIYEEIEENDQTFGRYYAIIRTVPKTNELLDLCIASMINDDFYEYSQSLA